ncbi:MAG: type II toxin-antitoxin system HicB family antitoxin [Terriglobales bacterium]
MAQSLRLDGFDISFEREADGRWIAEAAGLPGALAYGDSRQDAEPRVRELELRILADLVAHREAVPEFVERLFRAS